MTEDARTTMTAQPQPNIIARPIGDAAVHTLIGAIPGQKGPWSFLTGIPNPDSDVVGPPAQYLSVAAWAA